MAISVDKVYQQVLAMANKEQRGYITPQEFNILAPSAQMQIFEEYFYNENQADRNVKNSTQFSNVDEMIDEKISVFKLTSNVTMAPGGIGTLPTNLYRLGMVFKTGSEIEVEQMTEEEMLYARKSYLTKPTSQYPAYFRRNKTQIKTYPNLVAVQCNYIRKPVDPEWGYVVVNEKALYNASNSIDFQLHSSDEAELIYKILSLAGITIAKPGLSTIGEQQINQQKQQEKQ
mgnify:CR=1 FL=1|tara:strand:- start:642 stop:1331 length:690 start_codon:yes stop_codon:yes gene_type:complete